MSILIPHSPTRVLYLSWNHRQICCLSYAIHRMCSYRWAHAQIGKQNVPHFRQKPACWLTSDNVLVPTYHMLCSWVTILINARVKLRRCKVLDGVICSHVTSFISGRRLVRHHEATCRVQSSLVKRRQGHVILLSIIHPGDLQIRLCRFQPR